MKRFAIVIAATALATAAFAQSSTTVIQKEGVDSSRTIVKERVDAPVTVKKEVTTTGGVGCSSKTVEKTDTFGDTTTKKKVEC